MNQPEIVGAPQSNFVRVVRMACHEKGVDYALNPAFPHTPEVNALHPLGKIPGFRHNGVELCESRAICGYIDAVFPGPKLIPADPAQAAVTEQWISIINTAIDPVLVRQYLIAYVFPGTPDGQPDRPRIEASLPKVREMFALLDTELGKRPHIAGQQCTLADLFLFPIVDYMRVPPESKELLNGARNLVAWAERIGARESARATVPPPMPKQR